MVMPMSAEVTCSERAMLGAAVATIVPSRFSMKYVPATSKAMFRCRRSITRSIVPNDSTAPVRGRSAEEGHVEQVDVERDDHRHHHGCDGGGQPAVDELPHHVAAAGQQHQRR